MLEDYFNLKNYSTEYHDMESIRHLTQCTIQLLNFNNISSIENNSQFIQTNPYYPLFIHFLVFQLKFNFNQNEFYLNEINRLGSVNSLLNSICLRFNYTLTRQALSLPNIQLPGYLLNKPCVPITLANQLQSKLLLKLNGDQNDEEIGVKRTKLRFSREVVAHLKEQFKISAYPNEFEKRELQLKTELKLSQINIWFANQRMRNKLN